jgi:UDP-glucose:(heptosyl)LPS alpha-1,3-glucosyltransferase
MKIALIARPLVFHGGVETATAGLLGALVARGHELHLYSAPSQGPVPGVTVHRVPVVRGPSLVRVLWLPVAVGRLVRARDYDVVQSHERTLSQDIYRAGEGCHRAYLGTRGGARWSPYHAAVLALEARVFRRTPLIVAIARRGRDEIARLYDVPTARLRVVYNGVDLRRFHPDNRDRHRGPVLDAMGMPGDAWVVLFVGSGFARKGLGTLMEAFGRRHDPTSRLVVVGRGDSRPYRALAERIGIASRVAWIGPEAAVERWYGAADAVALPSRYEPFGNVYLEALASGVPVLASAAAGGAELVEPGRNGFVMEPDDVAGIQAGLDRLRAGNRGDLAAAARRSAEPYTYSAQVAAFERIYLDVPRARLDFR